MPRNINRFSSRYTSSMHLKRISHRLETVRYTKRLFSFRNIVHVLTLSRSIQPLCVFFLSFIFSTLSLSLSPLFLQSQRGIYEFRLIKHRDPKLNGALFSHQATNVV